jgi:hypothetical protein
MTPVAHRVSQEELAMNVKVATWNLNHRVTPKPIGAGVLDAIRWVSPDVGSKGGTTR